MVARDRPLASRSRANASMWTRFEANRCAHTIRALRALPRPARSQALADYRRPAAQLSVSARSPIGRVIVGCPGCLAPTRPDPYQPEHGNQRRSNEQEKHHGLGFDGVVAMRSFRALFPIAMTSKCMPVEAMPSRFLSCWPRDDAARCAEVLPAMAAFATDEHASDLDRRQRHGCRYARADRYPSRVRLDRCQRAERQLGLSPWRSFQAPTSMGSPTTTYATHSKTPSPPSPCRTNPTSP